MADDLAHVNFICKIKAMGVCERQKVSATKLLELICNLPNNDETLNISTQLDEIRTSVQPINQITLYNRPMEYRTNNAVQAYNRAWNWFVGVRHPSLWTFLTKLKRRQALHEVINITNGLPAPRRKRKWRNL